MTHVAKNWQLNSLTSTLMTPANSELNGWLQEFSSKAESCVDVTVRTIFRLLQDHLQTFIDHFVANVNLVIDI